jgi:hypothetical protein
MGTGYLPRAKCGQGMLLTTHPLPGLWVRKERGYTSSPPVRQNWHIMGNLHLFLYKKFCQKLKKHNLHTTNKIYKKEYHLSLHN